MEVPNVVAAAIGHRGSECVVGGISSVRESDRAIERCIRKAERWYRPVIPAVEVGGSKEEDEKGGGLALAGKVKL